MTPDQLQKATGCTADRARQFAEPLSAACEQYAINTPKRLAAFLAQVGHESGSLRYVKEIWGPTEAQSRYEGRVDLGNIQPGDGRRYCGRGLLQTTGRANYVSLRRRLSVRMTNVPDFESEPEKLEDPLWAAMSACDYWDMRKINVAADAEDFERVTRLINGGLNGYEDRKVRWEKAKLALADQEAPTAPIVEDTVPTPPKEKDMPIPAIIAAVLPSLIQSINIPKLTELFKPGSEVAERNVKVAEMVFETAKSAIGAVNEQEVVERVSADPVARESVRKAVEADWFRIDEAGGGGIAGARQADLAFVSAAGESRFAVLKSPSFLMGCLLLPLVYLIVLSIIGVVGVVAWSDDVRAALAGTIVGTIVGGLIGYYFGQTTSKNRTPAPE